VVYRKKVDREKDNGEVLGGNTDSRWPAYFLAHILSHIGGKKTAGGDGFYLVNGTEKFWQSRFFRKNKIRRRAVAKNQGGDGAARFEV